MVLIKITPEDVKRGKLLDPKWYRLKITDFLNELSSDKKSTNYIVDFLVTESGKYEGVPLRRYFNEKAIGMMVPFILALGGTVGDEGADVELSREKLIGREVFAFVGNRIDKEGKPHNDVSDFKAA